VWPYFGGTWPLGVPMRVNPTLTHFDSALAVGKVSTQGSGNGQTVTGGSIAGYADGIVADSFISGAAANWVRFTVKLNARL
jgi:hypothetical protein